MSHRSVIVLALVTLVSCVHQQSIEFAQPYRACVVEDRGGRRLYDAGWVVKHVWPNREFRCQVADPQHRHYMFQSDSLPRDGRHVLEVEKIRRPCPAAGNYPWEESP